MFMKVAVTQIDATLSNNLSYFTENVYGMEKNTDDSLIDILGSDGKKITSKHNL